MGQNRGIALALPRKLGPPPGPAPVLCSIY